MSNYPYSDDLMRFNETSGRYVITEEALKSKGIYLRTRLERYRTQDMSAIINAFCDQASLHVYTYIHQYSVDIRIDRLIAMCSEYRPIVYNAMIEQAKYIYFNGDQTLSAKPEERQQYIAPLAAAVLRDAGLLYAGGY